MSAGKDELSEEKKSMIRIIDDAGLTADQDAIIALYQHVKKNIKTDLTTDQIKLTSSSGSSVVLIPQGGSQVYQYYKSKETFNDIIKLTTQMKGVRSSFNLTFRTYSTNTETKDNVSTSHRRTRQEVIHKISYDLSDYIVTALDFWPDFQTIVWERIIPISELSLDFIKSKLDQLIWDIGKALNGFHSLGYHHGDCRYDNIGLKNGKFVLFDYNLSQTFVMSSKEPSADYKVFSESINQKIQSEMTAIIPTSVGSYKLFICYLATSLKHDDYGQIISQLETAFAKSLAKPSVNSFC